MAHLLGTSISLSVTSLPELLAEANDELGVGDDGPAGMAWLHTGPDYMPSPSGDSDGCYYTGAKGYSTKVVLNIT